MLLLHAAKMLPALRYMPRHLRHELRRHYLFCCAGRCCGAYAADATCYQRSFDVRVLVATLRADYFYATPAHMPI